MRKGTGLGGLFRVINMWFICALITTLAWGVADLFYKKGADELDRYSHLKTSMIVGFIMGGHAIATILLTGMEYNPVNLVRYLPVSAMYILSMTVGYFGLRYLELSISSPIQNSSGAVSCILCLVVLGQSFADGIEDPSTAATVTLLTTIAILLICLGVFFLGLLERLELKKERMSKPEADKAAEEKYRVGLVAFLMPILYCIIDALGTFFDAYYLDDFETTPLIDVTEETLEDVANVSYELTFLICGLIILVFLLIKQAQAHKIMASQPAEAGDVNTLAEPVFVPLRLRDQKARIFAALFETAGQATYVYALSGNGVVAAPMIASYSIVSLILSRIFLKEKLTKFQYAAVVAVLAGIALLGITESLGE